MSISAKERREIPDSKMGVPGKDKYPLRSPHEIKSANNLINNGDITPEEKKALARKIRHRAEEEGMDTSKLHAANKVAGVAEQVPPMSDGTSLGNAPPRMMAPYYDEQDELFSQLDKMDSRRHVLTFEDAKRIVAEIHAQVEKDSKPPTGNQNCQLCVWCAEAQCRGIKALPRPIYSPRDPALEIVGETIVLHPVRQKITSQRDVIEAVRSNVDSRWYVHVNWAGSEGGHEFLVVNINDYAYIMDPQAGILEEIDETDSPKVKYFMHANYANSYIVRLDNRSFNSTLLNLVNNPNRVLPWDPKLDIPYMKAHGMLSDEDYQAAMDMGDLPIQEAACTASLLTVKNQLMNLLGSDFEFIGGSLIPKFTMKSRMKPDVAIEVNIVGPNVEVTPVYKGIPDMLHKRRGIALMQASHVVADFARELVDNYKPKPVQEGAIQDIKNGVNPYSSKLVFHVTDKSHFDGQIFEPRVPEYLDPYDPDDKYFEDNTTPRVCFSTSIEGALNGIMCNMERDTPERFNKMYVYIPEKPFKEYKHKTTKDIVSDKTVWDANVTREVWITEPVRMKLYGVIQVDQVSDMKRKKAVPNAKNEKHTRPYFTFKWHWVVPPKVLEKSTKFEYSIDKVAMWLSNDLKKFKYGLIKDGRLQTGNVSESDYQKYWVYHSGEEVDQAGGGNCWDYVEYEAGFLRAYGVPYKKYFMNFTKTDGKTTVNTHTICVVPYEGKFIYIEGAFKRITSEWGHEWRRTFDSLKEIFQYVAEVSAEYENQDLNYGVWDYTDAKIDYGTPADDFCNWIMSKCRMIYDGEAKKPTVKKEGYRVSRFGNIFQEEDEKLSETENITIGDLDLGGDDDSDDEGPGLPGYIEDRMSDDDLEAYNSDDDDFKIPEEGDFESYKVSDEKLAEARGPIEPQPDENLDAANVDLGSFGKDTSDVQNEYDPKEVTILMKLMASEADAMNEYMDGAKETNIDVLRRLYADIANEERFHMEQLLYAKCELTGETYVPKDPDVKSEYEELLKMGMDEETAMQTAVDKCHIRGSITIEDDIDDVDEISKDLETMETAIMMFNALYDSTEMILESGNASKEDIERAMTVFTEACITQEAVYNATPADSEKSALSKANKHGPIQLLRDTIRFLIRTIMTIIRKFVEATKRISNRSREIRRFIKNNGLGAIFSEKASFYFVNLKFPQAAYVDTHLDTLLGLAADTLQACAYNLNVQLNMQINVQRDPKLNINNNMQRGAELLQGVQLVKSAFVIPKDNAEQERIAIALFGLSEHYDVDGKTYNTLNTLKLKCDAWSRFMQYTEGFLNELDKLQQHAGSVYYTNRKKYDQAEKCIEAVVKTCKAWVSAIQSDINTIIKLDQKAMIAATEEYEKQSKAVNPHQRQLSENYERNYRTAESSGQKVSKFSRFGR